MPWKRGSRLAALLPLLLLFVRCGVGGQERDLQILFEIDGPLSENMTVLQLILYQDPDPAMCDETAMLDPGVWSPTADAPFETVNMTYSETVERDLNPGRWAFVFRGGDEGEYPVGTREMGRGCTIAELESGINSPVTIRVHAVFYPGVCGDGTLDAEEMCDDGNTNDGDECSANCLSTPVKIMHEATTASQYDPAIAGGNFGYIVAFTSDADGTEGSKYCRAQKLDHDGNFSNMLVSSHVKLNIGSVYQSQEKPSVAISGTDFTAVWLDFITGTVGPGDVSVRSMDATNGSGAYEETLNTVLDGIQIEPVIAGNGVSTTMVSAWTSDSSSPQDVMCRLIVGGEPQDAEFSCASDTAGDQTQPAAAVSPDGSLAVAWTAPDSSGSGIFLRYFSTDGTALSGDLPVNTTTNGDQTHAALAFDALGRLLVVFRDASPGGGPAVRARLFGTSRVAEGDDFFVSEEDITSTGDAAEPAVAGDEGQGGEGVFIVVWYSPGSGVMGRLVAGQEEFAVNRLVSAGAGTPFEDTGEFPVTPADYPETRGPQVAVSLPGQALVIWVDHSSGPPNDEDIRGRVIPTI